jgi:hypothetical protein
MSISGIGSQSGFNPVQMSLQFTRRADDSGQTDPSENAIATDKTNLQGGNPAGGPPPAGPPPGGMGGGASKSDASEDTSSSSATYDLRDTNKDGVVSIGEEMAYAMKYSGSAAADETSTVGGQAEKAQEGTYDSQGNKTAPAEGTQGSLISLFT